MNYYGSGSDWEGWLDSDWEGWLDSDWDNLETLSAWWGMSGSGSDWNGYESPDSEWWGISGSGSDWAGYESPDSEWWGISGSGSGYRSDDSAKMQKKTAQAAISFLKKYYAHAKAAKAAETHHVNKDHQRVHQKVHPVQQQKVHQKVHPVHHQKVQPVKKAQKVHQKKSKRG